MSIIFEDRFLLEEGLNKKSIPSLDSIYQGGRHIGTLLGRRLLQPLERKVAVAHHKAAESDIVLKESPYIYIVSAVKN